MTIRKDKPIQKSSWDRMAGHPLQSYAWGEFRASMGVDLVRTPYGQMTFHAIPNTAYTIGYFPKGPAPTHAMIRRLTKEGTQRKAVFIQLEPNEKKQPDTDRAYRALGLVPSKHPLFTPHTFILDLSKSEPELLEAMHPKTRYNVRVAQRHGVVVAEDNSDGAFAAYLKLAEETTARQEYYAHNRTYHEHMWRIMRDAGIAHMFTASYRGNLLAAWIIFAWKKTLYYPYGTSSRDHREVMAPTLLLWEIARWGKRRGYTAFDLWGALGQQPDTNDPWYGFHRFKQGFTPDLVTFTGSYDLVLRPVLYRVYAVADTLRWVFLRLKARI